MKNMNKKKFIEELTKFKKDCTNLYWEFKTYRSKLNKVKKFAEKLRSEMDNNRSLYKFDEVLQREMEDGWNIGMWHRCDDILEFLPKAVESIDTVLFNVKETGVRKSRPRKEKKAGK